MTTYRFCTRQWQPTFLATARAKRPTSCGGRTHRAMHKGAVAGHQVRVVEQAHRLRLFANLLLRHRRRAARVTAPRSPRSARRAGVQSARTRSAAVQQAAVAARARRTARRALARRHCLQQAERASAPSVLEARTSLPGSCRSRSSTLMATTSLVGLHSARYTWRAAPCARARAAASVARRRQGATLRACSASRDGTRARAHATSAHLGADALSNFVLQLVVAGVRRHDLGRPRSAAERRAGRGAQHGTSLEWARPPN